MNRPFWSLRSASSADLCDSIAPLLSVYADGMASPAEVRRVEAHLPECEGCRAALSWMQATRTTLASRPVAVPPPDLHSRIALAIAASSSVPVTLRPARVFTMRTAYAAAASVTVLGAVLSYGLLHTPNEVAVKPPVKPIVAATVPPAVQPQVVPKTSARPLVASNRVKPAAVKHSVMARKTVPIVPAAPEHIASNAVPARLPAVPQVVKAPVHHTLLTQKIASREIVPTEKHSIEKHSPLPVVKTVLPKLPEGPKVAKVIKEPLRVPVDIQPTRVTPDLPPVRVASTHEALSLKSDDILKSVVAHTEDMRKASLAAIRVPAQRSYHEAVSGIQEVGNTDQTAIIGDIHGNQ